MWCFEDPTISYLFSPFTNAIAVSARAVIAQPKLRVFAGM